MATRPERDQVQTYSLVDQLVARLADDIIKGVYAPGERLKEQEIALRFGTSRAPLREALRVLERERLIEILPWRGAQVVHLSVDEIRELFEVRAELFGICARRLAGRGRASDVAQVRCEIDALVEATEAGCDAEAYKTRTNAISVMMSGMVGNRYLHEIMASLRQKMFWYYCFLGTATLERRRDSNESWRRLGESLEARDAPGAEASAHRIIEASGEYAVRTLESIAMATGLRGESSGGSRGP